MQFKRINNMQFKDLYEDLMDHQKTLIEATDTKSIIKALVDTSFGGDNESQMKAVQLLKGLATSDDPAANAFMKKLDTWTSSYKMNGAEKDLEESKAVDFKEELEKAILNTGWGNIVSIARKIGEKYESTVVKRTLKLMSDSYKRKASELSKAIKWF